MKRINTEFCIYRLTISLAMKFHGFAIKFHWLALKESGQKFISCTKCPDMSLYKKNLIFINIL